ncbi:unnamed protein product [Adineta steineri]|uniref:Uncharacterized protein n=1 Tax=Adineta steineri TaxID=433720 RepID=A0A813X7Y5_9BILA|nr:unnamed protein product [Adineta steineri]CAF1397924.1 unnamed protein product [Adineta steineri]
MAVCLARQSSLRMSTGNYPRKLFRAATYDPMMPPMTCRKRLLSEQNECHSFVMELGNDDIYSRKKRKIGNYTR